MRMNVCVAMEVEEEGDMLSQQQDKLYFSCPAVCALLASTEDLMFSPIQVYQA